MKFNKFEKGHIVEGFSLLPRIDINWMIGYGCANEYEKHWNIQFAWLFWYCSFNFISYCKYD